MFNFRFRVLIYGICNCGRIDRRNTAAYLPAVILGLKRFLKVNIFISLFRVFIYDRIIFFIIGCFFIGNKIYGIAHSVKLVNIENLRGYLALIARLDMECPGHLAVISVPEFQLLKNRILCYVPGHQAVIHQFTFIIISVKRKINVALITVITVYLKPYTFGLRFIRHDRVFRFYYFNRWLNTVFYNIFLKTIKLGYRRRIKYSETPPCSIVLDPLVILVIIKVSVFEYDRRYIRRNTVPDEPVIVAFLSYTCLDILLDVTIRYPLVHDFLCKCMADTVIPSVCRSEYLRTEIIVIR